MVTAEEIEKINAYINSRKIGTRVTISIFRDNHRREPEVNERIEKL